MFQFTPMVRNLLIANVVVFIASKYLLNLDLLALYPIGSPMFWPWQFLTYMFMHATADWSHIFSNMIGLIALGPLLEERWGAKRFLTFWLICGVGAGVLYNGLRTYEVHRMGQQLEAFRQEPTGVNLMNFAETNLPDLAKTYESSAVKLHDNPNDTYVINNVLGRFEALYEGSLNGPMVGASGALFGIIIAFGMLFPNTSLMVFPLPIPIKAKYFVILYGLYEFFFGIRRLPGDNIAHFAHLGGMLVGFIVLQIWQRNRTRLY
ncbi:rhomboid family intramembrane serine protease [Hymenobacter endophyticus]|uniref:Rhomboid family intramembrane serine protease n=1 Tax=Hymenobacter endophyticus TaxID=3076335 RepID=A0ABU3TKD1_9BACT|nr:rhomboid family intramembrane serine protease [Hymenobacter endophyticus]MDU0371670.1 rhomboid family intramembrane serine protease [Hymenobacter endophyticus]